MKRSTFHKIVLTTPAVFVALILRILGFIGNGALGILLALDIVGALGGVYWLHESKKISDRIYNRIWERKE